MTSEKNYPNIFVHGMLGWGERETVYSKFPYWGMLCGSLTKALNENGYESYASKVGSLASAWDRSCELYAQLMGTTVDYGKVHSEKYDHARFGRTFDKPLFKGWGETDENGFLKKINLLGHSFGGATMRMFVELLTNGSKEEQEGTDNSELSPLFVGGHGNWVHTITAISSPHNGTTIFYALPKTMNFAAYGTFFLGNILGNTNVNKAYDFCLEQFGLSSLPYSEPQYGSMLNTIGIEKAVASNDHLWYDLTLHGAKELNEKITCCKDTYYFSLAGQMTDEDMLTGHHSHSKGMFPLLWPLAHAMGKYDHNTVNDIPVDKSWCANDGCLSTVSGLHPENEPFVNSEDVKSKKIKKGVWHVMPVEQADHGKIIGGSLQFIGRSKEFMDYYIEHIKMLNSLA
ncbi:MAG: hypothetical protein RR343_05070 [Oscillospiraceae bacterium]